MGRDALHPALDHYVDVVLEILETMPLRAAPAEIEAAHAALVSVDDLLHADQRLPGTETYRRHVLYGDPAGRFTVLALVWEPGQFTPVHGHNAWGVVGLHRGELVSTGYRRCPTDGASVAVEPCAETVVAAGAVCAVQPDPEGIHRLANASGRRAISIHTYGMDLRTEPGRINRIYAD